MPSASLNFELPDDLEAFNNACNSNAYACVIRELMMLFDESPAYEDSEVALAYSVVEQELCDLLDKYGLDINRFTD